MLDSGKRKLTTERRQYITLALAPKGAPVGWAVAQLRTQTRLFLRAANCDTDPTMKPESAPHTINVTTPQLLRASSMHVLAALSAIIALGLPRDPIVVGRYLRLLLALLLWQILRWAMFRLQPSEKRWIVLLLGAGLLSVGSLQVFSASVDQRTGSAALFSFSCCALTVWLLQKGEWLGAWAADLLALWSLCFTSFLLMHGAWQWQPLALAIGVGCALAAPLLFDLYSAKAATTLHRRLYLACALASPLLIVGVMLLKALPFRYGLFLLYLPLTRPIHHSLQSGEQGEVNLRTIYCAALIIPCGLILLRLL